MGWQVTRPSSWHVVEPSEPSIPGPQFFLTNVPCLSVLPGKCHPKTSLPPDGVFISAKRGAVFNPDAKGVIHQGSLGGECRELGGDEVLWVDLPSMLDIAACLRGPDLAASKAAFVSFVQSMLTPN